MSDTEQRVERPGLDLRERGAPKNGEPQVSDKRIYFQLLIFTDSFRPDLIVHELAACGLEGVLYHDVNDPYGIGVLLMTQDPSLLVEKGRRLYHAQPFMSLKPRPEMTMMGRSYSTGREPNLEDWLLEKPRRTALNPAFPWAIWYPLRRKPEFAALTEEMQGRILMEHAQIGRQYGSAGLALDVRLACHGLDKNDNEFLIGLVASELYPLSRLVQDMRRTEQTSKYIQSLGPFFVGKVAWQSPLAKVD